MPLAGDARPSEAGCARFSGGARHAGEQPIIDAETCEHSDSASEQAIEFVGNVRHAKEAAR
jgi:hypothetical protein